MAASHDHGNHPHQHGPNCGHTAVKHDGHVDYVHDGHLHHPQVGGAAQTVHEHTIAVTAANPDECRPLQDGGTHDAAHVCGDGCGHQAIPHGDHVDYLVIKDGKGRLHHPHGDHCDDHGPVEVVQKGSAREG